MALSRKQKMELEIKASNVFTPSSPVDKANIFAGRIEIFRKIVDTINSAGQHAILYGERGVGKTSLANVISELLSSQETKNILAPRVNCDGSDTYSSVWKKVFNEISIQIEPKQLGFIFEPKKDTLSLASDFEGVDITPDHVKNILTKIGRGSLAIIVIDEFDRLRGDENNLLFADTIKTLSDYNVPATIIIVGVADNVNELINSHQSAERAIVQIQMPRMSPDELKQIIVNGAKELKVEGDNGEPIAMEFEDEVTMRITKLSQGLPHYTHLLALTATRKAIDEGTHVIAIQHLENAMNSALTNAQQTIKEAYQKAVTSPRKDNRYKEVLLACALAKTDDMGWFYAADVKDPVSKIMHKPYSINAFARHLNDFCDESRGPILKKSGTARRFRFRFVSPLMQPFVIMQGLASNLIDNSILETI